MHLTSSHSPLADWRCSISLGIDTILHHFLTRDEAETILNDCHSGAYGGHLLGLETAQKILCASYF